MSFFDRILSLAKLRIVSTSQSTDPGIKIPATPGMGSVEVVDTNKPPTSGNVPGSWSRVLLGPGQPFSTALDGSTGNSARDKDRETEPRTFQYVTSVNTTIMPRLAYGLTAFSDLRNYAETVPEVSMCIRLLTEEMKAFVPTIVDDQDKAVPDEENEYTWMTERPDRFNPWPVWLSRFMYNVLVYDAGCAYMKRDNRGKVRATRVVDGSTIFVVIDEAGEQPSPPAPAFQQIIWGIPRMFLNTRQLWYKPRHLRADAPYGRSPIEDSIAAVKLLQNLWDYEGQKYQVGNIPEIIFSVPEGFGKDTDQILEYEASFNARMSGSNKERVRARFVPAGTEVLQTKELTFNKESYDAATNAIRMSYGIVQSEVGEGPSGGLGGKGYAEAMQSAFYRMGLAPLISYVEGHFNDIIKVNGTPNRKFKLEFPAESLDPGKEEEKYVNRFAAGVITRDETRQGVGEKPLGGDVGNFIISPGGQPDEGETPPEGGPVPVAPAEHRTIKVKRFVDVDNKNMVDVGSRPILVKSDVDPEEFAAGMKEEQEHAELVDHSQSAIAQIVMDHLKEDAHYYTKLHSVMKLAKASGVEPADDVYFGAKIEAPLEVGMPHEGANGSNIVALVSGDKKNSVAAVWKPETKEKQSLREWVGGTLYSRAAAAYLLDRELAPREDCYLVPVTFDATVDEVPGSVQFYIVDNKNAKEVENYGDGWLEQAACLDYIMGQVDRHDRNFLTHPYDRHRPVLIDNDLSFPVNPDQHLHSNFIDAWKGKPLSDRMLDSIYLILGNRDLWADLEDVLDSEEAVANAKERAQRLYDLKIIPETDGSVDVDNKVKVSRSSNPVDVKGMVEVKKFDESKHPRRGKGSGGGEFTSGGTGDQPADQPKLKGVSDKDKTVSDKDKTVSDKTPQPNLPGMTTTPQKVEVKPESMKPIPGGGDQAIVSIQAVEDLTEESNKIINPEGRNSLECFSDKDGNLSPERQKMADYFGSTFFKDRKPVDHPESWIMGGGPASGKTTLILSGALKDLPLDEHNKPVNVVTSASDDIKVMYPEWTIGVNKKIPETAIFLHEEACLASAKVARKAIDENYNCLLDGTGDSSLEKLTKKVKMLRGEGRPVHGIYVTCDLDKAFARADSRMKKTGRGLSKVDITRSHAGVSQVFPQAVAAGLFDDVRLYDTNDSDPDNLKDHPPKLIASAKGTELTVYDKEAYQRFLDKGKES